MTETDAAAGVLLGMACGDALGRPVEFKSDGRIADEHGRVTEMLANGTHRQPEGTITDDTQMALCIARSLAEQGGFDGADVARRFVEWYESGPFDIGLMTADALREIRDGGDWRTAGERVHERRSEGANAGNGSVMRCAPYALAFEDAQALAEVSRRSSAITHADARCTDGCAVLNLTIRGFLDDEPEPLTSALTHVDDAPHELREALGSIPEDIDPSELQTSGYVVTTLQTALYDALSAPSAREAIVTAVNRGGDTDTIGAVAGAVAGARFGASGLPDSWLDTLSVESELRDLASTLANGTFVSTVE
ncbi:MAG: ADP-ribosyl-[dinitrogen reductase] hydrolase [Natronomonas sp.]|jgi:ADP-ribosyl-[dinitrogen reductase] hydrolase